VTPEKLKSVLQQYYRMLADDSPLPISAKRLDDEQFRKRAGNIGPVRGMSHTMWMCVEAQKFVDEGRVEKAMRWLGFIQGVLWMSQARTLAQLKDDSRPDSKASEGEECPNCHNGTIGLEEGELRCLGECGAVLNRPEERANDG
jgi:hypothetical protein